MGFEAGTLVHAGEIVVDALIREGVTKLFCTPGSHVIPIYDGLRSAPEIELVKCKQEPNASLMADAYGRLTGKPGVCLLTAGPGGANSIAGVAQAYGAASPVVHITGAVPLNADREAFHGVDDEDFVVKMFDTVTKWSVRVKRMEDIAPVMAKAFRIAKSGRPGPVHVEIPRLSDLSPYMLQIEPIPLPVYKPEPVSPAPTNEAVIDKIADRLRTANLPVICAGKGVIRRNAMAELLEVSNHLSIPVIYPQDSMGVIPSHADFSLDHYFGNYSSPLIAEVMADCDLLLSIGLRADTAEVRDMTDFAPDNHILVGFDDDQDDHYQRRDWTVMDPKLFLGVLAERARRENKPVDSELKKKIAKMKFDFRQKVDSEAETYADKRPIHPGYLMKTLASCLKSDSIVVSDVGNCQMFSRYYIPLNNPLSYMQSGVWNAMSFALPTAIVAKLEYPERDVVSLIGDGAFLMTMGDFITACEMRTNIVFVILNDGAYGQMIPQQMDQYGSTYGVEFLSPDFSEFARSCGAIGIRVEEPGEIEGSIKFALNADGPAIVEFMTKVYPLPTYK